MEKKSIGRFIAALRKANGMTQKELAEQLNVSDKAVSRWEREESAPDLSLIPVIAEIFHVTSDEILRGERINYQETVSERTSEKGKKQIAMLLNQSKVKFQMYSVIARGIAGIGIIAAMICNMGFNRAYIGFFTGCIFCMIGLIMISVCLIKTQASIHMEDAEEGEIQAAKKYVIRWFYGTIVIITAFFAFLCPLIALPYDAYVGITVETWIAYGLPAGIGVGVAGIILWWLIVLKKFSLLEEEKNTIKKKLTYVKRTAMILVITFCVQGICFMLIDEFHPFIEGTTFRTYKEFREYMGWDIQVEEVADDEMTFSEIIDEEYEEVYYDDEGNEITLEEYEAMYMTNEVCDKDGNIVCTYIHRNENVVSVRYGHIAYKEGEDMPITVYTHQDIMFEESIWNNIIQPIFVIIYIAEMAAGIFFIRRASKK